MTNKPAITIEEKASQLAGWLTNPSFMKNHFVDALTEAYARGRRDMGEEALKAIPEGISDIEYAANPDQTDYNVGYDFCVNDAKDAIRSLIEKETTK